MGMEGKRNSRQRMKFKVKLLALYIGPIVLVGVAGPLQQL